MVSEEQEVHPARRIQTEPAVPFTGAAAVSAAARFLSARRGVAARVGAPVAAAVREGEVLESEGQKAARKGTVPHQPAAGAPPRRRSQRAGDGLGWVTQEVDHPTRRRPLRAGGDAFAG